MTKKQIAARRQYLSRLVQADRANRCAECLTDLTGLVIVQYPPRPEKYCKACAEAGAGRDA